MVTSWSRVDEMLETSLANDLVEFGRVQGEHPELLITSEAERPGRRLPTLAHLEGAQRVGEKVFPAYGRAWNEHYARNRKAMFRHFRAFKGSNWRSKVFSFGGERVDSTRKPGVDRFLDTVKKHSRKYPNAFHVVHTFGHGHGHLSVAGGKGEEIFSGLEENRKENGPVGAVVMNGCLNGSLETVAALGNVSKIAVFSQTKTFFNGNLAGLAARTAAENPGEFGPKLLEGAREDPRLASLSAVDLEKAPEMLESLDRLGTRLTKELSTDRDLVLGAALGSPKVCEKNLSKRDLGGFLRNLQGPEFSGEVRSAAGKAEAALKAAMLGHFSRADEEHQGLSFELAADRFVLGDLQRMPAGWLGFIGALGLKEPLVKEVETNLEGRRREAVLGQVLAAQAEGAPVLLACASRDDVIHYHEQLSESGLEPIHMIQRPTPEQMGYSGQICLMEHIRGEDHWAQALARDVKPQEVNFRALVGEIAERLEEGKDVTVGVREQKDRDFVLSWLRLEECPLELKFRVGAKTEPQDQVDIDAADFPGLPVRLIKGS